jgi:FRG domain
LLNKPSPVNLLDEQSFYWENQMSEVFRAKSIHEAVELAQEFQREGKYDLFRGQARDWPPVSSLHRRYRNGSQKEIEHAQEQISLFWQWIAEYNALSYLTKNDRIDEIFAIAQHYGIPTHYIDFTSDAATAGFFAADSNDPMEGESAIYCLNSEDLADFYGTLHKAGVRSDVTVEKITVEVKNLWRLQAQKGVFIFADYNWDIDYPLDKILFPRSGYPSYPSREQIYPSEKSQLEVRLDRYFDVEIKHFAAKRFRELVEEIRAGGKEARYLHVSNHPGGIDPDAIANWSELVPLSSWTLAQDAKWHASESENFADIGVPAQKILVDSQDPLTVKSSVKFALQQTLLGKVGIRDKLVEWELVGSFSETTLKRMSSLLRDAWSGMRRLPYANSHLASAFASIVGLAVAQAQADIDPSGRSDLEIFSSVNGAAVQLEFGCADGSSSRGYADLRSLEIIKRASLHKAVRNEYSSFLENVQDILRIVNNPTYLFEFDEMLDLFADCLIPSQLVFGRKLVLYNPAELTVLGLP